MVSKLVCLYAARGGVNDMEGKSLREALSDAWNGQSYYAKLAAQKATEDAQAAARQSYGQPVGAGGGTPSRPALEDTEALRQRVTSRLQKGEGLQDSQGKTDAVRYGNMRLAEGIIQSQTNPSYRSFSRTSPDDRKIQDDRTKRKG